MLLCVYPTGTLKQWHYALVSIVLTTFIREGNGIRITQCVSNMVDLDMESSNNEITCVGDDGGDRMTWKYIDGIGSTGVVTCSSSGSCEANALFTATRGSQSTSSTLKLKADVKRFRASYGTMNLTCITDRPATNEQGRRTSCELDVVHRAEVTSCNAQFNTAVGTDWTSSGSCIISKAFSQRGRYSCLWTETTSGTSTKIQSSRNFTGSFDEGGVTFISMTCDFQKSLPRVTGRYSYTAVISPGAVQPDVNFNGSSSVVLPTAHTNCPTDYVMEGDNVDCTCSSSDGNPAGSAVWRDQSGSSGLELNDVRRDDHDDVYVCEVKWGSDVVSSATFRLQVAYGPNNVTINGPPQPFDTDGTKDMAFTCTAGPSRPGVTYQWRPLYGGKIVNDSQITLNNVNSSNDGDKIECTAANTKFSAALRASRYLTLDLHYPPTDAPVIQHSSNSSFVYEGNPLTLICTISGGKPVNATTLNFNCSDRNGVQSGTEVSSSVTFDSVVASNNGDVCRCGGRWKGYNDWYTLQAQTAVVVYYAPSKPNINAGSQPYPFLAGESPTLYCNYPAGADPGNPNATLILNSQAGGPGQGQASVTFAELNSTDNGRRMVCEASNQFTVHNNTRVTTETLLQVYYPPVISVTSLTSDMCSLSTSSSSVTCVIMEGQRVKVNCTAHSNPSIATIAWKPGGDNVLDLEANHETDIDHNCTVTTIDEDGSGDRLPLHNNATLVVLVQYKAEVSEIAINGDVINQTVVNENDIISLNCTARGRPTAGITLKKNSKVIGQQDVGDVTRDDKALLVHTKQQAQCEDAGLYTCNANNGIGDPDEYDVKVFVNCRPRLARQHDIVINYVGQSEAVNIELISYPVPKNYTLLFTGLFNNASKEETQPTRDDMYNVTCAPTDDIPSASTNCTLTVFSAAEKDKGFYVLTLANQWGNESIRFELDINRTEIRENGAAAVFPIAGAVGGIGAAIAVVAILAFVIIFTRRKREQNKDTDTVNRQRRDEHHSGDDDSEMIVNELYGTSRNENSEMIVNELYGTTGSENTAYHEPHNDTAQRNVYEDVVLPGTSHGAPNFQGAGTTGTGDVYASVKKTKQPQGATATVARADDNVYSTVDKKKKNTSPSAAVLKSAKAKTQKPDVKEKRTKKSKSGNKQKIGETKQKGTEYTNMTPLSMSPPEPQATVYENFAFQADDVHHANNGAVAGEGTSQTTNPDGLLYSTIAFTKEQLEKAEQPPPERETTEYVDIDFVRTGRK